MLLRWSLRNSHFHIALGTLLLLQRERPQRLRPGSDPGQPMELDLALESEVYSLVIVRSKGQVVQLVLYQQPRLSNPKQFFVIGIFLRTESSTSLACLPIL